MRRLIILLIAGSYLGLGATAQAQQNFAVHTDNTPPAWLGGEQNAIASEQSAQLSAHWSTQSITFGGPGTGGYRIYIGNCYYLANVDGGFTCPLNENPPAIGYHTVQNGVPTAIEQTNVGCPDATMEAVFDHEVLETMIDPQTNRTATRWPGTLVEIADPVQGNPYPSSDGYTFADWTFPSNWDIFGVYPYDYLGVLNQPSQATSPGNCTPH